MGYPLQVSLTNNHSHSLAFDVPNTVLCLVETDHLTWTLAFGWSSLFLYGDHPGRRIFILPSLVWMNVLLKYFLSNSDIWLSWSPSNCVKTLMRLFKVTCLLKPSKFEFTHLPQNFWFLLNHVSNPILTKMWHFHHRYRSGVNMNDNDRTID